MTDFVVQVAMVEEAQPFLDRANSVGAETVVGGVSMRELSLGDRSLALVIGGIGLVNSAHAATAAISRYGTSAPLISAGSAGGVSADSRVGDVVIATDIINLEADAQAFGYALGQTPGMPAIYSADTALADALVAGDHGQTVPRGAIGSGEKFITADLAHAIRRDFPYVVAVDMESVAIAQVAHRYGVRFAAVRAISDLCAPDGEEFLTHIDDAVARSAAVVVAQFG
ncbi:MAG: 5-methylthioadenosine/S-adenosylhomocysteine nucleosidase [Actinomycetota bacterium]